MISTRELSALPDVDALRRLLQSMAMLDAILSPEWDLRYYSFDSRWGEGEQMGSMRNGSGDHLFALFNRAGCFLKGFAHEAEMSPYNARPPRVWPGVLEGVPEEFSAGLTEPAFTMCLWRKSGGPVWRRGPVAYPAGADPDGSAELLSPLDDRPESYEEWAEEYYEQPVDLRLVQHVYAHQPLTEALVLALNPDLSLDDLADEIEEIGYPA